MKRFNLTQEVQAELWSGKNEDMATITEFIRQAGFKPSFIPAEDPEKFFIKLKRENFLSLFIEPGDWIILNSNNTLDQMSEELFEKNAEPL